MRKLRGLGAKESRSSEALSVLQLRATNEPMFPNLKTLDLWHNGEAIPFIPLFLSPRTTAITLGFSESAPPNAIIASVIATFPTLCPNLQEIILYSLPRGPMVTAAVSGMVLASNENTLRCFRVDSPLTEAARQVIYKLLNLRNLSVVIERDASSTSVVLPNLTNLAIKYDHEGDWLRVFHGATFGKLESVTFHSESEQIGDFLEEFERVALAVSAQDALSGFSFYTSRSWNPNYSSLLRFTQLVYLRVQFSCDGGCSSTVDDDIITNLARAMPKLKILELGNPPCREIPIGITAKGLMVLAHHCPDLYTICIHFQVASLCSPSEISVVAAGTGCTAIRKDCALVELDVGEIPVPEESVLVIALTLAHIFPRVEGIDCVDQSWYRVVDAICVSREIIDGSSKEHPPSASRSNFSDASPEATIESAI